MKIFLCILLLLLFLIFLILITKINITVGYRDEPCAYVGAWGLKINVLKVLSKTPKKEKTKKKAPEKEPPPKTEKKAKSLQETVDRGISLIKLLLQPAVDALKRLGRTIRIERLEMNAVIADENPAVTGMTYGCVCAAFGALQDWFGDVVKIRHKQIYVVPDFNAKQMRGDILLTFSFRIINILVIAAIFGYTYLKDKSWAKAGQKQKQIQKIRNNKQKAVNHNG